MNMKEFVQKKKAELHLHLDGSLRTETVRELAVDEGVLDKGITLNSVSKMLKVDEETKSLVDYLRRFDLPLKVMQTRENLTRTTFELIEDLARENYIYAEIRFAPHLHTTKGLRLDEIVEAVLSGARNSKRRYGIKVGIILCLMRHMPPDMGIEIVKLADECRNMGVVGIDLAGDEKHFSCLLFKSSFDLAREKELNVTIHAGESDGPRSVLDALKMGAVRIGHGVRSIENMRVVNQLVEEGIGLEVCPTSNFQTRVYEDFSEYPLKQLIKNGVFVSLNTDNRTVSDTNLAKEVELITMKFGIGESEIDSMLRNSVEKSFLPDEEKGSW